MTRFQYRSFIAEAPRSRRPLSLVETRARSSGLISPPWRLPSVIPEDVFLEIAQHLPSLHDIRNFSLTSSLIRAYLLPLLYASVELKSTKRCKDVLTFLDQHRELLRYIRSLTVHPNGGMTTHSDVLHRDACLDESWVARRVEELVPNLCALHSFVWGGLEMPTDSLWLTLRVSCPRLRVIGTGVGMNPVSPDSHLFEFTDLLGFSLYDNAAKFPLRWADVLLGPYLSLPNAFWEMLLIRSPDLQSLSIDGAVGLYRTVDISQLSTANWPQLKCLTLSDIDDGFLQLETMDTGAASVLSTFLQSHRLHLETLSLKEIPDGVDIPLLPRLVSFSGPIRNVSELPNFCALKTFQWTHAGSADILALSLVLPTLPELESLSIKISFMRREYLCHCLQALFCACQQVSHLELVCRGLGAFYMKEFYEALRGSQHLKSFVLTKTHRFGDEDMTQIAARVARENPGLRIFKFNMLMNHRSAYFYWDNLPVKQTGIYAVEKNADGKAVGLRVQEWRRRPLMRPVIRRFWYNLQVSSKALHFFDFMKQIQSEDRIFSPFDKFGNSI